MQRILRYFAVSGPVGIIVLIYDFAHISGGAELGAIAIEVELIVSTIVIFFLTALISLGVSTSNIKNEKMVQIGIHAACVLAIFLAGFIVH